MTSGDVVAVRDPDSGRWRSAAIISINPLRATVATATWWAVVPRNRDSIRPVRVVRQVAA